MWVSSAAAISTEQRDRILSLTSSLVGTEYGLARHCGGIVLFSTDTPLPSDAWYSARQKEPFAQLLLDKDDLERAGLSKLDVLSNHALSHLRAMGLESTLGSNPIDFKAGKVFSEGDTWGIVQGESPAMRKIFLNFGFSTLQGVTLALGLVRPATGSPSSSAMASSKPGAVGRNPIERRLIYEDDITEFLAVILGSSPSLAEYSRRVLLKGGVESQKLLEDMERLVNRKGRDKVLFRGEVWSWSKIKKQLGLAASYAFCKAHATAYGRVVWALGFAKAHYPELFWTSFIPTAMASSMYLPWVHFERLKWELGVEVVWPGDLSIAIPKFFSYPWRVTRGVLSPDISFGQNLFDYCPCGGLETNSGLRSVGEGPTPLGMQWGGGDGFWERQLRAAGFWSGSKSSIPESYVYEAEPAGSYEFRGLRALKAVRVHPLNKQEVCLFQTLGVGRLKIIEYSKVFSASSPRLVGESAGPFFSGRGRGRLLGASYYLRDL
jgi:hypothetical protein